MPVLPEDQNTTRILLADPIAAKVLNKVIQAELYARSPTLPILMFYKRMRHASPFGMMKTLALSMRISLI